MFTWQHLITLFRYRAQVLPLDYELFLTHGNQASLPSMLTSMNLGRGVYMNGCRSDNGVPDLIGQMRYTPGQRSARMVFLAPEPECDTPLLNVLMDAGTTPAAIDRTGIDAVTPEDIRSAAARGKVIKLVCSGEIRNGQVLGKVAPAEVDRGSLFATITGTSSVVSITTDLMGTVSIVEHDPEILQTGYGVFSDLLRILARTAAV